MPTGRPLTPAQIPRFQLPSLGQRSPGSCSRGHRPSAQGPCLLHVPVLTTALGFQVFAERPRVLSQEAPLWKTLPGAPADGERTGHSLTPDRQDTPETPPPGSFQKLPKMDQILWVLRSTAALPFPPPPPPFALVPVPRPERGRKFYRVIHRVPQVAQMPVPLYPPSPLWH